jgi:hypothetical protein
MCLLRAADDVQELIDYRAKYLGPTPPSIMALGLSSRKNLCIHPQVAGAPGQSVQACVAAHWGCGFEEVSMSLCSTFAGLAGLGNCFLLYVCMCLLFWDSHVRLAP